MPSFLSLRRRIVREASYSRVLSYERKYSRVLMHSTIVECIIIIIIIY